MTQNRVLPEQNPCLVLAHMDIGFAARVSRQFRLLGWDVYLARTGAEARRLTQKLAPAVVVLDVNLADESGWLLCDKLSREEPAPRIVLIGPQQTPEQERLASFVGAAALIPQRESISVLVNELLEAALSAAS
jgi:DNA-binding response OmpR family regulator